MGLPTSQFVAFAYQIYTVLYVFGGIIPYIPQYFEIGSLRSIKGFSIYVCLVLLIANILRVCFWFVEPFSTPLLVQSLVMVGGMLVLLQRAASVLKTEHHGSTIHEAARSVANRSIWNGPVRYFWQWTDFGSYLVFVLLLASCSFLATNLMAGSAIFVQTLGFVALFTEALLGLPQLVCNYRNRSTRGMSLSMVLMWMVGDVAKSIFFIVEDAPVQFPLCGGLQVSLDVIIIGQYLYYRELEHKLHVEKA